MKKNPSKVFPTDSFDHGTRVVDRLKPERFGFGANAKKKRKVVKGLFSSFVKLKDLKIFEKDKNCAKKSFPFLSWESFYGSICRDPIRSTVNCSIFKTHIFHGNSPMELFHPESSFLALYRGLMFLKCLVKLKQKIRVLFLNTNPEFAKLVKTHGRLSQQYYINTKWVGGTLTNWKRVSKSIKAYHKFHSKWQPVLTSQLGTEESDVLFPQLKKMTKCFSGYHNLLLFANVLKKGKKKNPSFKNVVKIKPIIEKPDVLIVLDASSNQEAIKEANSINVPVLAFVPTNTNVLTKGITFPIPANTDQIEFINFCLNWITKIVKPIEKKRKTKLLSTKKTTQKKTLKNSPFFLKKKPLKKTLKNKNQN